MNLIPALAHLVETLHQITPTNFSITIEVPTYEAHHRLGVVINKEVSELSHKSVFGPEDRVEYTEFKVLGATVKIVRVPPKFRVGDRVIRNGRTGILKYVNNEGQFWLAFDDGTGMFTTTVMLRHEKKPPD